MWTALFEEDGTPNGLMRVWTPEETASRRTSVWEDRKPIMVDPENIYSEYVSPLDYPSDFPAPWWIKNATRQYIGDVNRGVAEAKRTWLPIRCKVVRHDNTRCWNWVSRKNETRCKQHLGWVADEHAQKARVAKARVMEASILAAETLEDLAYSASGEAVRLKASTEILDRAGVRGGTELEVTGEVEVTDPSGEVKERLDRLAKRMAAAEAKELADPADTVDAEIVADESDRTPAEE